MDANKKGSKTRVIVYQPVTPACNKTLRRKWDDQVYYNHRIRVKRACSLIDNKAPRIFFPMNLKKAQVIKFLNNIIFQYNIYYTGAGTRKS